MQQVDKCPVCPDADGADVVARLGSGLVHLKRRR